MQKALYYVGLLAAVAAVILAIAGAELKPNASSHTQPESAIGLAIAAFVFLRASEMKRPA